MLENNEGSLSREKAFHLIAFFLASSMTVINVEANLTPSDSNRSHHFYEMESEESRHLGFGNVIYA